MRKTLASLMIGQHLMLNRIGSITHYDDWGLQTEVAARFTDQAMLTDVQSQHAAGEL